MTFDTFIFHVFLQIWQKKYSLVAFKGKNNARNKLVAIAFAA